MAFQTVSEKLARPQQSDTAEVTRAMRRAQRAQERRIAEARAAGTLKDEAIDTIAATTIRAKWKIELTFGPKRTVQGPNAVGIQVWESGKHFHGGGDALAFFCKDNREGHDEGCWGVIPQENINGAGVAFCPSCELTINAELLTNMKRGYVSSQNLAKELAELFRRLDSNADIYIKYHKTDVRYLAMERAKGAAVARRLKGMHIYLLKNIIKDTAAGADLGRRFFAFITS
jgi:hypothetical protein